MTSMDIDSPTTPSMAITPVFPTDNNERSISEEQPNKRRRKKSIVWEHFTIETVGAGCMRACCKQCKKSFAYITGSKLAGTSHLKRHIALGICPVSRQRNEALQSTSGAKTEPPKRRYRSSPVFGGIPFDQEGCNQEVAKMIIQHEYPLHIVEHPAFVDFVRTLQPQYNMMSFNTIQGECVALYLREKQSLLNLINALPGRVSLTLDLRTSNHDIGYAYLTGHFIDNEWILQRRILNVVMLPFPDSEYAFNQAVVSCLSDWQLENTLFTLTLDQSFSNETIVGNLRGLLSTRNPHVFNGQLLKGNCYARVLSRLAQYALGRLEDVVRRIRESVKYVKTSETHEEKFAELRQRLQVPSSKELIIDDQTKWNTTYQMLLAACELKEVFACLDTTDPIYKINPSMDDWKQVEVLCTYLKLFYDAASILTAPTYPPANAFYHEVSKVQLELTHAALSQDPFVRNLTRPLKEKFDQYWKECFLVLAIAVVMDPRFKMKLVEFSFSRIFGEDAGMWIKIVDDGIHELFLEYLAPNLSVPTSYMEAEHASISHSEIFQEMPPQEVEARYEEVPIQSIDPSHRSSQEANPQANIEVKPEDAVPQLHPKEEPSRDSFPRVIDNQEVSQQEMHIQGEMITHEVPMQQMHNKVPVQEMLSEGVPMQKMHNEEEPAQNMHSQEAPQGEMHNQTIALQETRTPIQETKTAEDPVQEMQTQKVESQEIQTAEEPTQENQAEEGVNQEIQAQGPIEVTQEIQAQQEPTQLTQEIQAQQEISQVPQEVHAQQEPIQEMQAQEEATQEVQAQEEPTQVTQEIENHEVPTGEMQAQEESTQLTQESQAQEKPIQEMQAQDVRTQESQGIQAQEEPTHEIQAQDVQTQEMQEIQVQEEQTQEMQFQDVPTQEMQEIRAREEPTQEMHAQDVPSQVIHEDGPTQEVPLQDMPTREIHEDIPTQEMHAQNVQAAADVHSQELQATEVHAQELQDAEMHEDVEMHAQDVHTAEVHTQEVQTIENNSQDVPTEVCDRVVQTEEVHAQEVPTEEVHAQEVPTEEVHAHAQEVPTEEIHAQEVPTEDVHAREAPTEEIHAQVLTDQIHQGQDEEMHPQGKDEEMLPQGQDEEMQPREQDVEMQPQGEQNEDLHPQDEQNEDMPPQGEQNEDMHPQVEQTEELHPQGGQTEELHPQGEQTEESHPQGGQTEESHPQGEQEQEMHPQGGQTEEIHTHGEQTEEIHTEEINSHEGLAEEMHPQGQTEEMHTQGHAEEIHLMSSQGQSEEIHSQVQPDEKQPQEVHPSEGDGQVSHHPEALNQEIHPIEVQIMEMQPPEVHTRDICPPEAQTLDMQHQEAESQETHLQEVQIHETYHHEISSQYMHSQEVQIHGTHHQEIPSEAMHSQEAQMHETHYQEIPSQAMHSEDVQMHETHHQELRSQDMQSQELQTQEMHYQSFSEGMQPHDVHAQDLPLLTIGDGFSDFEVYISEISNSQHLKSELDQYLEETLLPRVQEFDVLGWWRLNKLKYPTLSKMAADILSIPVSTVAPESVFDTRSKKMDSYRSSLRPVTLEALVCAKDWLQYGSSGSSLEMSNAPVKMEF